ncbi:MAG: enoyl-CoA hydratase/isomerase family protein [Deltaproteobacteria bacterium]|nr:enoyl-CoA hydratase/isomerase family protein [Deltaproteobacteria bacterium]
MKKNLKTLSFEFEAPVAFIYLNRAAQGNAYNQLMGTELLEALKTAQDSRVRSVVLMSEGKDFCVGYDPQEVEGYLKEGHNSFLTAIEKLEQVLLTLKNLEKPLVAAVQGRAAGTGFGLALACDLILASPEASFSTAYINVGLSPDAGLSYTLTRLVGPKKAAELMMTGKSISAKKALEMGMISGVISLQQLRTEAKNLAFYFGNGPTLALSKTKTLIDRAGSTSLEKHLQAEREALLELSKTKDFKRGFEAFLGAKTRPKFMGD